MRCVPPTVSPHRVSLFDQQILYNLHCHADWRRHMEKPDDSKARHRNVANTLASLKIENLQPSEEVKRDLDAYAAGRKSIAAVVDEVLRRHVPLRRA